MIWRSKNIGLGDNVELAPRKSYIAFARGKIFAVARASTKTRLDLGHKLPGTPPRKRLVDAAGLASDSISHKGALYALEDIDGQVIEWLHEAYRKQDGYLPSSPSARCWPRELRGDYLRRRGNKHPPHAGDWFWPIGLDHVLAGDPVPLAAVKRLFAQ